jgi:hypothetical protein
MSGELREGSSRELGGGGHQPGRARCGRTPEPGAETCPVRGLRVGPVCLAGLIG